MNQNSPNQRTSQLLVSVRSADEALIAQSSGTVGIIDLKEPTSGSLGSVSFETAQHVCAALSGTTIKSIALGEALDGPIWHETSHADRTEMLGQFQFAKVGLAGLARRKNWTETWKRSFADVPEGVSRVAVAYADCDNADSPAIERVIESAEATGCTTLLIDTFGKAKGNLLDFVPFENLDNLLRYARKLNLQVVLAGSLRQDDIETVTQLSPDFIAVRGAVCSGDRSSGLSASKLLQFGVALTKSEMV